MRDTVCDDFGEQGNAGDRNHLDVHVRANESWVSVENADPVGHGPAGELDRACGGIHITLERLGRAFDEDFESATDKGQIVFHADGILNGQEVVITAFFSFFRNIVRVKLMGLGAAPGAVFEDEAVFEAASLDKPDGLLEGFFGLSTEPDNEVAGDSTAGDCLVDSGHHFVVLGDGVETFHAFEHFVAATLGRYVDVSKDFRDITNSLEEVVGHILGEAGDKFDSAKVGDPIQSEQEVRESPLAAIGGGIFVAVDGLTEEGDFGDALIDQQLGFFNDIERVAALFRATGGRDHAIGAELVAAHHDAYEGLVGAHAHGLFADRVEFFEALDDFEFRATVSGLAHGHLGLFLSSGFFEEFRNFGELAGTDHDIDKRGTFEDFVLILLGHTAEDTDGDVWASLFDLFDTSESGIDFIFSVLADGAGVEQDGIREERIGGQFIALGTKFGDDQFTVENIHLTADGVDKQLEAIRGLIRRYVHCGLSDLSPEFAWFSINVNENRLQTTRDTTNFVE